MNEIAKGLKVDQKQVRKAGCSESCTSGLERGKGREALPIATGVRKAALRAVPGAFCHARLDVSLGPASGSRPRSFEFYGGDLSALRSGGRGARRARASHAAVAH